MKKYLIIRPKYGLCNQLLSISKGIIIGEIIKRDIIFIGFQIDYRNESNICNFKDIIDIEHLKTIIKEMNLNVNIDSKEDLECFKIKTLFNEKTSVIKDFIPLLENDENKNEIYLDVDNPISCNIPLDYEKKLKYININIKFTNKYIELAHNIKNSLKLENYTCIHLRLEDDSIYFMNEHNKNFNFSVINEIYKSKYLDELNYLKSLKNLNTKIYVCTSLLINDNKNNDFYKDIKKKYNLLDKNDFINDNDFGKCREIYGIIDYIIAQDSIYFIGSDWSSFSIFLSEYHNYNKKANRLIDIYKTIMSMND
jgi:hypothetical protein